MKILILGASGTVGLPLFNKLSQKYEVHGSFNRNKPECAQNDYWHKFDISDISSLDIILQAIKPHMVISSLTGNFEQQILIHQRLNEYLQTTGGRVIFISTANVFDGDVTGQHAEMDAPYPISGYGKFKQACEELLQAGLGDNCLIIRLPKIIDSETAEQWLKQAETGDPPVYANLYMSFNTPENVANATAYCVAAGKHGVLHLTSRDSISISQCMDILLANANKKNGYTPQELTVESFCALLGCEDTALLRHNSDGQFRMELICTDPEILSRFGISCNDVLSTP
ncbi:MAG: sugar nucleotide-binding protein [Firmicutes bacterium]|nr:sugar nucleotide-binding protein [Bacillota bacterium]